MAKNITLFGTEYADVSNVSLPKTGGGTALFNDTTGTTSIASDIAAGMTAWSNGVLLTGTMPVVTGSFTTSTTTGAAMEVNIPYNGTGYPISIVIFPTGGAYNSENTAIYDTVQRYAIVQWAMTKAVPATAPTYSTSGGANYGVTMAIYKSSSTSATTYAATSGMTTNSYSSNDAANSSNGAVRFKSAKKMSVFVASTSAGFFAGASYTYIILYSS